MSNADELNAALKSQLMAVVRKAAMETSLPKLHRAIGLLPYQGSQLRKGDDPMISLERLFTLCRALGYKITVHVGEE